MAAGNFHKYLYGYEFDVQNDHKPLSYILTKPLHQCLPHIQRFYLKLMKYNFKFEHQSGKKMTILVLKNQGFELDHPFIGSV